MVHLSLWFQNRVWPPPPSLRGIEGVTPQNEIRRGTQTTWTSHLNLTLWFRNGVWPPLTIHGLSNHTWSFIGIIHGLKSSSTPTTTTTTTTTGITSRPVGLRPQVKIAEEEEEEEAATGSDNEAPKKGERKLFFLPSRCCRFGPSSIWAASPSFSLRRNRKKSRRGKIGPCIFGVERVMQK